MSKIAIIDDNLEQSDTLKNALNYFLTELNSPLSVITQFPFKIVEEYFSFVNSNDICLLILDEKLNDQSNNGSGPVEYKGNELVGFLRSRLKDFPIYSITTFSFDSDLQEKESEFEGIFQREEFIENGKKYVPKLIRAAQRYLDSNSKELSRFESLTKIIASGDNDPAKIEELNALQAKLELPFSGMDDRTGWLNKYKEQIDELSTLMSELSTKKLVKKRNVKRVTKAKHRK